MENLRGEIAERLQQLGASRELHQKQSADYQQALQQLTALTHYMTRRWNGWGSTIVWRRSTAS